jgi:putative transposase
MEKANYPITLLCEALGVSRAGYYEWQRRGPSSREQTNEAIVTHIRAIHAEHKQRYGSPRMTDELKAKGVNVNRKRVERLMREKGIVALFPRKFRRTTDSEHRHAVAPNLLEQKFHTAAKDQVWVGDITYIWTLEGWAYLAVLIDLFSRRVVGWAMGKTLSRDLAIRALRMAIRTRKPPPGLIHHTDRGSQYASGDYRKILRDHGLVASMSGKGNCYDNAVAESFFATIKKELVHRVVFFSRSQAYRELFSFIDGYYNTKRRHSANANLSPVQFENSQQLSIAA